AVGIIIQGAGPLRFGPSPATPRARAATAPRAWLGPATAPTGYSHRSPTRRQLGHSGSNSWHFIFLRLQFRQPLRDFLCPFRGIGLRRGLEMLVSSCWAPGEEADSDEGWREDEEAALNRTVIE